MKVCLIVNPHAGPSTFKRQIQAVKAVLTEAGCQVKYTETESKGHATKLAQQAAAEGFDTAVAVGGDGTVNEVCNGLAGTKTALAVLPAGTANVYAAEVGIPIWHPLNAEAVIKAAQIIINGQRRPIDLGHLRLSDGTGRYFLMWCGVGLDAAITKKKGSFSKSRPLNYATWIVSGVILTYDFMGVRTTLTTDNGKVNERVIMVVASNGQLYGRVWRLAPQAKMDDGLLDVGVLTGYGWPSTVKHIVGLTFRRHVKDPDFHLYRTATLSLTAGKYELPVHVDAETIGTTPVEIEVAPLALNVVIPQNTPSHLFERTVETVQR